jgi:hypothetical protein
MTYCKECLPQKKQAKYGREGGKPTHCAKHGKAHGFIDVVNKRCDHDGCKGFAVYSIPGGKKTHCGKHKLPDMIDVVSQRCDHDGCDEFANYGIKGGKRTRCRTHKSDEMINVASTRCDHDGCDEFAIYGIKGGKKTRCRIHKSDEMINVVNKRCDHDGCDEFPIYGIKGGKRIRCHAHKSDKMVDVMTPRCTSCKTTATHEKDKLCAACRQYLKMGASRKLLRIEHRIIEMLFLHGTIPDDERTKLNKSIGAECGGYRPDIYIDCGTFILVVEIDEHQHRSQYISRIVDGVVTPMVVGSYSTECEFVRMMSIVSKEQMPVYFIRFNPDKCTIDGQGIKVSFEMRCDALRALIKSVIDNGTPAKMMTITYMYYDGAILQTIEPDLPAGF